LRVFEKRILRRIFGRKREEVVGGWRRLHNEELHNLYASPTVIRVIRSRRMRWMGHVARMGEIRTKFWSENLKGRDHTEDLGIDEKIIFRMVLTEIGWEGVDRIHVAQDGEQWRAVVNMVMDLRVR
jgi:hypothetical protein